jgi:hypothetical protein
MLLQFLRITEKTIIVQVKNKSGINEIKGIHIEIVYNVPLLTGFYLFPSCLLQLIAFS